MSNIFDALQRAESEGSEGKGSALTLATELLQAAEQKLRDSSVIVEPRATSASEDSFAIVEPPANPASGDSFDPTPSALLGELDRCPVLPGSIREDSRLVS